MLQGRENGFYYKKKKKRKNPHVAHIKESPPSEVILQHVMFKMFGWRNVLVCVCASAAPLTLKSQWTGPFCHKTWCCNISRSSWETAWFDTICETIILMYGCCSVILLFCCVTPTHTCTHTVYYALLLCLNSYYKKRGWVVTKVKKKDVTCLSRISSWQPATLAWLSRFVWPIPLNVCQMHP